MCQLFSWSYEGCQINMIQNAKWWSTGTKIDFWVVSPGMNFPLILSHLDIGFQRNANYFKIFLFTCAIEWKPTYILSGQIDIYGAR